MASLRISELARHAGVNIETVRYYERRGLIPAPPRTRSGYRQYAPTSVRRIVFIKRAQTLGFTLDEIGALLALRVTRDTRCDAVAGQAEHAMARIDVKVRSLSRMRAALTSLIQQCREHHPTDECPILEALDGEESA